jgi:hypothetical protein
MAAAIVGSEGLLKRQIFDRRRMIPWAVGCGFLAACGVGPAASLTPDQLANGAYAAPPPLDGTIQLTGGEFRAEVVPGAASELTVTLLPDSVAFGDLDADGDADAAAVLAASGGGSGTFLYLVAVENDQGRPRHVATAELGDRVQVESVMIESGEIVVSLLTHAPTDPLCCPTQETVRRFRLEEGALVEVLPTP